MKSKLKYVRSMYRQMSEYHHHKTKLSILPQIAEIEVTNNCNLRCRFCSREAIEKHRGLGYMSLEQFKTVLKKCKGHVFSPSLSMHGEPTLHPDLAEMVRLTKLAGARSVSITSNGTLLNEAKFIELVNYGGLDGIEVSFEGTDKKSYEFQRVGAKFDVVQNNLLKMVELKKSLNLPVNLGINIIDNQITHDKLPEFKQFWNNQGIRVDVSQQIDWVGTSDQEYFHKTARPETFQHPFSKMTVCPMPWFFIGIDYNGWVVPCCHWLSEPFGNIFEQTLEEIWNGPKYIEFRRRMAFTGRQVIHYCSKCWDGSMRIDSPFFQKPNSWFPFDRKFVRNAWMFLKWSHGKYKPSREL